MTNIELRIKSIELLALLNAAPATGEVLHKAQKIYDYITQDVFITETTKARETETEGRLNFSVNYITTDLKYCNTLQAAGIIFIKDLVKRSSMDLLKLNIPSEEVIAIKKALSCYGLYLKDDAQ